MPRVWGRQQQRVIRAAEIVLPCSVITSQLCELIYREGEKNCRYFINWMKKIKKKNNSLNKKILFDSIKSIWLDQPNNKFNKKRLTYFFHSEKIKYILWIFFCHKRSDIHLGEYKVANTATKVLDHKRADITQAATRRGFVTRVYNQVLSLVRAAHTFFFIFLCKS